jgi:uncharacterized protein YdeI (BOF family)
LKFSPSQYDIKLQSLDEETAIAKYNMASFNFKLTGFTLSSSVIFSGESHSSAISHPQKANIGVNLLKQGKVIATTKTDQHGEFTFNDVSAGEYEVHVRDEDLQRVKFRSTLIRCQYSLESGAICKGDIVISGTTMQVRVSLSGEPITKGVLLLRSSSKADLSDCAAAAAKQNLAIPKGYECAARIKDSVAEFHDMPFAKYSASMKFDSQYAFVEPQNQTFDHPKDLDSHKILNFVGYSNGQKCQLVTPKGTGIEGVEIKIDGEKRFVTDKAGYFIMDKLKMGNYEFEALHPNFVFNPRHVIIDGSSELSLEKVKADLINLCGKVDFVTKGTESSSNFQASVQIESTESREKRSTKVHQDGTYCYELPPGVYTVKPNIVQNDKQLNVVPRQRTIKLLDEPALDVDFSREKLSIKGSISYPVPIRQSLKDRTEVLLLNAQGQQVKVFKGSGEQGFEFGDIFEDGYILKISNSRICFEKETINGDDALSSGANFVAKGVQIKYRSDVRFQALVNEKYTVEFSSKKRSECIPASGKLTITAKDHFTFKHGMNTVNVQSDSEEDPKELVFEVEKIKLMGKIRITSSPSGGKDITSKINPQTMNLKVKHQDGRESWITPVRSKNNQLEYFIDAKLQDSLIIQPNFLSEELKKRMVVEPTSGKFSISEFNGKFNSLPKFRISQGKLIKATFNKEVKGVKVLLLRKRSESTEADFAVFNKVLVSGNSFELGPFSSKYQYGIKVSKIGSDFKVKEGSISDAVESSFEVDVVEISQLTVKVVTGQTAVPLEGVVIYVTSTDRNNYFKDSLNTGKKGSVTRTIQKGEYFIKPVLKEYEFDPPQSLMKIEEGQKAYLLIKAKRTQFSALGTVRSFGGYAIDNLKVEATCEERENMKVEASVTDKFGNFIIKGLVPGKTYSLKVAGRDKAIIIPDGLSFTMEQKDSTGVGCG